MRLSSTAVVAVVAASSLPAYSIPFQRDDVFADLKDHSLRAAGHKIRSIFSGRLPALAPGPFRGPVVDTTMMTTGDPNLVARGIVHDLVEKAKHKVHDIFHDDDTTSAPLAQPTGVDSIPPTDPSQFPVDPTGSGIPVPNLPGVGPGPAAQPSRCGFEKRRTKSRPAKSSGSGFGSTVTSILNHPALPGLVDSAGTLAGTIIAAKQQHDQNELLKQQLAAQQAQAQAQIAQAQQPPPPTSTDPSDPSQTGAPVQRRRIPLRNSDGYLVGADFNANGGIPVAQVPSVVARGKLSNLATLADHINHGLSSGLNAFNQAQMMAGMGGLGVGVTPGFTDPSVVGSTGTFYGRDYYGELNDLD
ncbi:hypothetical protein QCA50_016622 [Cerrena zonata]|uniref:Uncharacterized protein n=1 Tax=Cerrena zonata TaxID=2478898 RepID=A0AAW0FSV9_9APHY